MKKKFTYQGGIGEAHRIMREACIVGTTGMYDNTICSWLNNVHAKPILIITTERTVDETQALLLSIISGIHDQYILDKNFLDESEEERLIQADKILIDSPIYIEILSDKRDIRSCIEKHVRENDTRYVVIDHGDDAYNDYEVRVLEGVQISWLEEDICNDED